VAADSDPSIEASGSNPAGEEGGDLQRTETQRRRSRVRRRLGSVAVGSEDCGSADCSMDGSGGGGGPSGKERKVAVARLRVRSDRVDMFDHGKRNEGSFLEKKTKGSSYLTARVQFSDPRSILKNYQLF
jgi:hypothetical protein